MYLWNSKHSFRWQCFILTHSTAGCSEVVLHSGSWGIKVTRCRCCYLPVSSSHSALIFSQKQTLHFQLFIRPVDLQLLLSLKWKQKKSRFILNCSHKTSAEHYKMQIITFSTDLTFLIKELILKCKKKTSLIQLINNKQLGINSYLKVK